MNTQLLVEQFLRLTNIYQSVEGKSQAYGTNILLTRTEIHTIESIGNNPGVSITELSRVQGVSKSAVTQMITRLKSKHLVDQTKVQGSERDTRIELTELGKIAYSHHAENHKKFYTSIEQRLQSMPSETLCQISKLFEEIEKFFSEWLIKKERKDEDF